MADILHARIFAIACGVRRMPTISTGCAAIQPSSLPAGGCPTPEPTCARSRLVRGLRTCPTLGPSSGSAGCWSICGCRAMPRCPQASRSISTIRSISFTAISSFRSSTLTILRPGKTPTGEEIRGYLRRLVRRIRARWPATRILIRGDGYYGRAEVHGMVLE